MPEPYEIKSFLERGKLVETCYKYWKAHKGGSPEADSLRETINTMLHPFNPALDASIRAKLSLPELSDGGSPEEKWQEARSLGNRTFSNELMNGSLIAAILSNTNKSIREHVKQLMAEFPNDPRILDEVAPWIIDGAITAYLMITQDMGLKTRAAVQHFGTAYEEARAKLAREEITQEQANRIFTITPHEGKDGLSVATISPGPDYSPPKEYEKIIERRKKLSDSFYSALLKELKKPEHGKPAEKKIELRPLDLAPGIIAQEEINIGYVPMYQGPGINALTRIRINKDKASNVNAYGDYTFELKDYNYQLIIKKFEDLSISNVSADQLLKMALLKLTEGNTCRATPDQIRPEITIPLDEYMKLRGIPQTSASYKKARLTIKEDLETFKRMWISWEEKGKDKAFGSMVVCQDNNYKNGTITFTFGNKMAHYLINAYTMQFPTALFKIKGNSPNAYRIGCKLALHNSMDSNKRRGTDNILSVESLVKEAPEIPTYLEVMDGDRHAERRIIDPLEKALDTLCAHNVLTTWEYCNKKREPLTRQQIDSGSYSDFSKWYVHFELKNAPDQTARIAKKDKEKAEEKKATHKRKEKALQKVADRTAEKEDRLKAQIAMEEL